MEDKAKKLFNNLVDQIDDIIGYGVLNCSLAQQIAIFHISQQISMLVKLDESLCDAVVKLSGNPAIERIKWQEQMWHKTVMQEVNELRGIKEYLEKM